jgi:ketosteroid isomerase-like protein
MSMLLDYIDGWRRHDVTAVLDTLTADCMITECYGPVYRGRARVEQWMRAWFGAGGTVDSWEVTWHGASSDFLVAEWRFGCTWQGDSEIFEGASAARLQGGKIAYLREYATTAPLYDWTGSWRE